MTPEDVERLRTRVSSKWMPSFRCADCWSTPTCPMLTDAVWFRAWSAHPPRQARRCNCDEWRKVSRATYPTVKTSDGETHHLQCDLARVERRPLLCLECAEERLGRRIEVSDLESCVANYHTAVALARVLPLGNLTDADLRRLGEALPPTDHDDLVRRVADAIVSHVERDQTPDEAERELRAAGVDVDRFMTDLRRRVGERLGLTSPDAVSPSSRDALDRLRKLSQATPGDLAADPYRSPPAGECNHGVVFDGDRARGLTVEEIRRRWPRLDGPCPLGCGYSGIAYASRAHLVMGDW